MKKIALALLAVLAVFPCLAQEKKQMEAYVIGFYNLENLFDTIDDPDRNDEQFLPGGDYGWSALKYESKLSKLAYAISRMPRNLAILGVAEAENIGVLEDLVLQDEIADRSFKPILVEGNDARGIDVGLIYNPRYFTPTNVTSTRIRTEGDESFRTRDQLCVTGLLAGEEISIVVLHWPSRGGGEKRSAPRRRDAALTTKAICDSLYALNPQAKIVVMGDLNDDPVDDSVVKHLGAKNKKEETQPGQLYNPCYTLYKKGIGSLGYQDEWNLFDQVMVSHALIDESIGGLHYWKSEIFNRSFLKQQEGRYKGYPLRTHSSGVWTNGYSDHFPSLIWVVREVKGDQ